VYVPRIDVLSVVVAVTFNGQGPDALGGLKFRETVDALIKPDTVPLSSFAGLAKAEAQVPDN
jgi:hypothetical protein